MVSKERRYRDTFCSAFANFSPAIPQTALSTSSAWIGAIDAGVCQGDSVNKGRVGLTAIPGSNRRAA
ncbi:hypothetical protein HMPREF9695_01361 [Afipia broomeae ATCC 49717]|uniref:Uncharacterized protein n=1 Tax=Afipia broomeae ATCC 49717 TaxID=883078 RepID=K8PNB8_9BRAD|nr:hypothetical protein HMPREF9695_01361 [Afipia broomeae ATCC 49717]